MSPVQKAVLDMQHIRNIEYVIKTPECVSEFISRHFKGSANPIYKPTRAMRLCLFLLAKTQIGQLDMILPDGKKLRFLGNQNGPSAMIHIHNDRVARRFFTGGKLGFCESYLDGDWSSPDIALFFEFILRNADVMRKALLGKRWVRALSYLAHVIQPNSKKGSQKNIYRHYDIGNDFYRLWLDESMTYSSAYFKEGNESIIEAQQLKYKEMADRLELKPDHHVLEIGCGWGGFAEYAATHIGCKMTCITVSKAQHKFARERIEKAGLSHLVDIRLQDYRDVTETFDRIASIEMFEAVGEAYWPTFFQTLRSRLKDGGRAVLQIITIQDEDFETYRKGADYIQRYIFPGGMLPSMKILDEQIAAANLSKGDVLHFGKDYAKTLDIWNDSFQEAWPQITKQGLDTRFKRMWEQYLCYCQAGFEVGTIDVIQIGIDKK